MAYNEFSFYILLPAGESRIGADFGSGILKLRTWPRKARLRNRNADDIQKYKEPESNKILESTPALPCHLHSAARYELFRR